MSTPANAGNTHVKSGGDLHPMIEISERMVDYLDKQLPEVEALAKRGVTEAQTVSDELKAQRALIESLEAKLRKEDEASEEKVFRSGAPFELRVLRGIGEVIVDSYKAFRTGYRNIPEKYRTGQRAADQYEGADSLGGITVPTLTRQDVAYLQREKSLGRDLCFTFPMVTDKLDVPAVQSGGVPAAYYVSNGNAPGSSSPITFDTTKQMVTKTLMAYNIVEGELVEDTVVAYQTFWAQLFLDQFSVKENLAVFSSTPNDPDAATSAFTGAVQAVVAAGTNIITTATSHFSSVSYDNLVAAQNAIDAGSREGAVWVMNKAAFRYIQALRDSNGFPLLASAYAGLPAINPVPQPISGRPTLLMGDPCYITEAMPGASLVGTSGKAIVLYGNFKKGHYFGDRMQMAIQWSSEAAFTAGSLVMRARERFACLNVLTPAFAVIKNA